MPTFKVKEVCQHCDGTGLYQGMAERDGAAVVCYLCNGTGCCEFEHTYEEFKDRKIAKDVKRVYKTNPGICIGGNLSDFGGIPYQDWYAGKPFPRGSEDRKHVCPCWWYQSTGEEKPGWKECRNDLGRTFEQCKCFSMKDKCWKRWDKECEK